MKIGDYNKFKEYFEANPEAQEAPDEILKDEKPAENQVTIEDLMKSLNELREAITAQKSTPAPENDNQSEIEALKASVKDLTAEMQKANQANTDMPKEETADDILSKFITGGI